MKKHTISILIISLIFVSHKLMAQQQPNFLFFEQNMGVYNPAFTGSEGALAGLGYRAAWAGIKGAPRASSFIFNTKEKNKAAWGLSYVSERVYMENQGRLAVDYSYKLPLGATTKLHLGIKAGLSYNNIDIAGLDRITQENNPDLNNIQNYINPLVGIGALLKSQTYFVGVSFPTILNSKRYKDSEGVTTSAVDKPQLITTAGVGIKLSNTISLNPSMLYSLASDAPNQITGIAKLSLKEKVILGMGISNNDYISAMLRVNMNQFALGFGYEMGQRTSSTALRANTSELMLMYRF